VCVCVCVYNIQIRIYARRTGCGDVQVNSSRAATDCYNFRVWPIIIGLNSSHGRLVCVIDAGMCPETNMCVYVFFSFFTYHLFIYVRTYVCVYVGIYVYDCPYCSHVIYILKFILYIHNTRAVYIKHIPTRFPRNHHCV